MNLLGVYGGSLAALSGNATGDRPSLDPRLRLLHGGMGQEFDSLDVHERRSRKQIKILASGSGRDKLAQWGN